MSDDKIEQILLGQARMESKIDLHIQKTEFEFKAIRELDEAQNASLEEHKNTCVELRKDNALREEGLRKDIFGEKGLEKRITDLELPRKILTHVGTFLVGAAIVLGSWTIFKEIMLRFLK